MVHFLIQTIRGHVVYDFSFHLIKAIEYHNWIRNKNTYHYTLSETIEEHPDCIPIGSLEFVFNYLERYHSIPKGCIKPINIPLSLRKEEFLGRKVQIATKEDIPSPAPFFVKFHTEYKTFTDAIEDTSALPEGNYLISPIISIDSEWRAFVHEGKLVGLQHYVGDFTAFPDVGAIQSMIQAYKDAPLAYTLDVGMVKEKCVVIEVHSFVSCGLYGFQDYKRLPIMLIQGFNHMRKEAEKEAGQCII